MNYPISTYRIQLHKEFNFSKLIDIIDYLHRLGVHTIYASPILKSRAGSTHGYDVVDPHQIDPEIGTLDQLREIALMLRERNMMWIQDIVPNHMAFDTSNTRLMDVLERGPHSPYYEYFDIDWKHFRPGLRGKIMVPFLGDELTSCIEKGEVSLAVSDGGIVVKYFDTAYPLSVPAFEILSDRPGFSLLREFIAKSQAIRDTGKWHAARSKMVSAFSAEVADAIVAINQDKRFIAKLLDACYYQLAFWKRTETEINYRRFFTVNDLICLRVEQQEVFDEYHTFLKQLYDDGYIQGLRIDHIDGLYDPAGYVTRLRKLFGDKCYIIAEKILEAKEDMPEHWPIEGTSGYEFLSYVNQLITERAGSRQLVDFYHRLIPDMIPYDKLVLQNKRLILDSYMRGEWDNLFHLLKSLELDGGFPSERIRETLALIMLAMPVYRAYPERMPLRPSNAKILEETFARAFVIGKEYTTELTHFKNMFLSNDTAKEDGRVVLKFLKRLMQFTGPLTAKGVEDTTFYVYNPLISHDEVGDAPSMLAISLQGFHDKMIARWTSNRYSLNATATHDTKRGEDARIRVNVLSEIPEVWEKCVREWMAINQSLKRTVGEKVAPTVNDEYFIYQSLIGGFPENLAADETFLARFDDFLVKAMREAKAHTNWSSPDEEYEKAATAFVRALFSPDHGFAASFIPFLQTVIRYAEIYSLIQAVVKLTTPGIADTYQGCELWDLSFVDPDNRRPVDYNLRKTILDQFRSGNIADTLAYIRTNRSRGFEKMFVTHRLLVTRRELSKVVREGEYIPLTVQGKNVRALAYARREEEGVLLVMLPLALGRTRQTDQPYAELPDETAVVELPDSWPVRWENVFTGEVLNTSRVTLFDAFKDFPVAVFRSAEDFRGF